MRSRCGWAPRQRVRADLGLGSATEGTARLLITGEDVDEQEVELEAGDEVEVGGQTLVAEKVRDGTAYLRFRD